MIAELDVIIADQYVFIYSICFKNINENFGNYLYALKILMKILVTISVPYSVLK